MQKAETITRNPYLCAQIACKNTFFSPLQQKIYIKYV